MHNNRPERPLQKSMFLPASQPYINTNTSNYQYQGLIDIKRTPLYSDSYNNYPMTQTQLPNPQYNNISQPILNFSQTPRQKQIPTKLSNFGTYNQPSSQEPNLKEISQKLDRVMNLVQNHDEILKSFPKQKSSQFEISEFETRLSNYILPNFFSQSTKEIYSNIFNFKSQIQTLKDQIEQINGSYKTEIRNWFNKQGNNLSQTSSNSSSTLNSDRGDDSILSLPELSSSIFSMQSKLLEMQNSMKSFIQLQMEKHNKKQLNFSPTRHLKSGIQTSLSPILIEYQQLFLVKSQKSQISSKPLSFSKQSKQENSNQILINFYTYHIDPSGYLLDQQNRYIIDRKGMQIKLDQKHLNILRKHNVLSS